MIAPTSAGLAEPRDPLALLARQNGQRLSWLVPVRYGRMAENPFAFFRGAAAVMASDLGRESHSGQMVQLCGDAHLLNFGFFGSPERQLLFDINDFDETCPGPFEWDVQRLATSLILAARRIGLGTSQQQRICRRGVRAYARAMARFAAMPLLTMWVARLDLDRVIARSDSPCLQEHLRQVLRTARRRDSRHAVRHHCEGDGGGGLRFRHCPPLVWRLAELEDQLQGSFGWQEWTQQLHQLYLPSVRHEIRHLLSRFQLVDAALKAVGVGSVGSRCAIGLFISHGCDDVLVLQSKEAQPSVLAPYLPASGPTHQGERVVQGQRLLQTASDPFLGWTSAPGGKQFYWRHFRDWKASVQLEALDGTALAAYAKLCAWTLAKAHARTGDRAAISARMGDPRDFARALLEPALRHADQAEADHRQLLAAIAVGRIATWRPQQALGESA